MPGRSGQHRFSGRTGTERFLEACDLSTYPWSEQVVAATPAGPCATYPGDDTWTDTPYVEGVVLVGDAAGHNDPIIGQGLSIALRDARIVRDLVLDGARDPAGVPALRRGAVRTDGTAAADRGHGRGLAIRGRRQPPRPPGLRGRQDGDDGRRDLPAAGGAFIGPEQVPDELVDTRVLDRIRRASKPP